jgi:hypothetical protein
MPRTFSPLAWSSCDNALRRIFRRLALAGVAFAALAAPTASADGVLHVPCSLDATEILRLHNQTRQAMGVPPLRWSEQLAAGAQQWANELAVRNQMVHSHAPDVGENLAMWWGHHPNLDTMVGMWTDEKGIFQPGIFPANSTGGSWQMVAHYTQMIWRTTTQVGCGVSDNGRTEYLVCWYDPKGNIFGEDPLNPDQHGQFQSLASEAPSRLSASQ